MLTIYDMIGLMPDSSINEKEEIKNSLALCEALDKILELQTDDNKIKALMTMIEIYKNRGIQ